jgi:sulfonate transport system substrate-binding protein
MKKFKIGGVPEHFNLPWRLAIEERRLEKLDVDMHWSDMAGGTGQMIKGLQAGTIDIAVLLTEGITKSILEGLDAKILTVYVKSPLRWGIHVPFYSEYMERPEDIRDEVFAISREGSGSHLMAYVNAYQRGWGNKFLKFEIVGDVYGGLWALENKKAGVFLWEKYTTHPFVAQEKCKCIGEVVTPWPCFVVAVRNEVFEKHKDVLKQVVEVVGQTSKEIKDMNNASEISWRYSLELDQAESWLSETDWNYTGKNSPEDFALVVDYLSKLNLITPEQKENWKEKLF